jgi:hypothetical protein
MRVAAVVAVLAIVAVALAGCSGKDPDRYPNGVPSTSPTSRSSSSGTTTSSHTSSTGPDPGGNGTGNHAPVAHLAVDVNGTAANFTLDGTDADNDTLSWTLDFGDGNHTNGTSLPATVAHDYAASNVTGNLTASLNVTDGSATGQAHAVVALGAGGGGPLFSHSEGTKAPGNPANSAEIPGVGWCGSSCCAGFDAKQSGVDCVFVALPDGLAGHPFLASADAGDPDLEFWGACDPSQLFAVSDFRNDGPESGAVPGGVGCVIIWDNSASGAMPTFTFTVT